MPMQEQTDDLAYVINDLNARIRLLEGKYNLFGERLLIVNKNMIEEYKKTLNKQKALEEEIKELKMSIELFKDVIKKMESSLKTFAKKEDLKVLEKYIELWNPVRIVTEEDVVRIISRSKNVQTLYSCFIK